MAPAPDHVDLLVLGSGWTGTFLLPQLAAHHPDLTVLATTRDGRNGSLAWTWQDVPGSEQFLKLPAAKSVIIVFPLKGEGQSRRLVEGYESIHGPVRWIQLGSSGIFDGGPTLTEKARKFEWTDRFSPYALDNARAIAEDELLSLRANSYVLNLSGLWGGERDPINWITRVAPTKEALAAKGSIHLIHGLDVARAIIAVHQAEAPVTAQLAPETAMDLAIAKRLTLNASGKLLGKRYVLTDLRVYDWWDLIAAWGLSPTAPTLPSILSSAISSFTHYSPGTGGKPLLGEQAAWVLECMEEQNIHALPRTPEELGRAIDSRDFWNDFGLMPIKGRLERGRL